MSNKSRLSQFLSNGLKPDEFKTWFDNLRNFAIASGLFWCGVRLINSGVRIRSITGYSIAGISSIMYYLNFYQTILLISSLLPKQSTDTWPSSNQTINKVAIFLGILFMILFFMIVTMAIFAVFAMTK